MTNNKKSNSKRSGPVAAVGEPAFAPGSLQGGCPFPDICGPVGAVSSMAVYARSACDGGDGSAVARQNGACVAAIVRAKLDPDVVFYEDRGMSGSNVDRPGLSALLENVRLGRHDLVYVEHVDRLGRNLCDLIRIFHAFRSRGVSLRTPEGALDLRTLIVSSHIGSTRRRMRLPPSRRR